LNAVHEIDIQELCGGARDKMNEVQKKVRGRPRKDEGRRRADRAALIGAAVQILEEGGAGAFSARAVAGRAGTAVGSVYTLFESLEALRLEANAVTMRELRGVLAGALESCRENCIEDRLLCLADAYLRFAAERHNAWAALFERRTIPAPPEIAADISALFAVLEDLLREGGLVAPEQVPVMARALWSSVHGMVYLGEIGGLGPIGPQDVRPMIDALVRAAVRGMRTAA
jgi:AcrR family transcriptional regulator